MEAGATWQLLEQSVHIHPTYGRHCQLGTAADWRTCRRAQIWENSLMTTNLQVGDRFPDFELNHDNEPMRLSQFTQPSLMDKKLGSWMATR